MSITPDMQAQLTAPFWRAAAQGRLELPCCPSSGKLVWYPQQSCPDCGEDLLWRELSGRGTVAAFTVVRRPLFPEYADWVPFIPALIALEEDPSVRLVSQLVDCQAEDVACDLAVQVTFRKLKAGSGEHYQAPLFLLQKS